MRPTSFVLVALAVLGAGSSPASVSAAESGSATASATLSGTKTSAPTASIIRPPAQNTLEPLPWPTLWDTMLKVTSGELTLPYNFKTLEKLVNANPTLKNLLWGKVDYAYKNMTWFAFTDDAYKAMDTAFGAGYTKYVEGLSADLINYHILPKRMEPMERVFSWERTLLKNTGGLSTIAEGQQIQIDATVKPATQADWNYVQNGFNAQGKIIDKLPATNGILYVVDAVIVPPFTPSQIAKTGGASWKGFSDALTKTNTTDDVDGLTRATIFAPTTDAWNALPQLFTELEPAELEEIMKFHVLPDQIIFSKDMTTGQFVTTGAGNEVDFIVSNDTIRITDIANDATIVTKDTLASNGVIHTINKVLIPEKYRKRLLPTIAENIEKINNGGSDTKNYKLGTLASLLKSIPAYQAIVSGSSSTSKNDSITLFAPTDRAFFNPYPSDGLIPDAALPAIPEILAYHVLSKETDPAQWTGEDVFQTLLTNKGGLGMTSLADGQRLIVGASNTTKLSKRQGTTDWELVPYAYVVKHGAPYPANIIDTIECKNGRIYVVDDVLMPPTAVTASAQALGHTAYVDAVTKIGRNGTIDGLQKATFFVPNNKAFNASAATLAGLSNNQLEAYLQHHVYNGLAYSTLLKNAGDSVSLVAADGTELKFAKTATGYTVDGAKIVASDILTKNGVIHVVDKVLAPTKVPDPSANPSPTSGTSTGGSTAPTTKPGAAAANKAGLLAAGAAAMMAIFAA